MKAFRTITVGELIDLLKDEDRDAKVIFTTDYGDYHNTEQALPIRGSIDEVTVEESAYSNSGFAIAENEDSDIYLVIK